MAQQAVPVKKSNGYELSSLKGQVMGIDPEKGGRITLLSIDGKNFLTDSLVNKDNWGSTFWPSPQSDWNWPPPAAWDNQPYTVQLEGNRIKMQGGVDSKSGLAVTKIFSADVTKGFYELEYVITNQSALVKR
ncbi:hypothetical protein [Paraflavitalea speifideaquila]|uniref:hypothetical protein n=1 Tax=Paraflavitalea speifideaquila TaxID=3076558 RepID=UPI0028E6153C|nr:hypothetical protein [Paraflavitalea speifideiaquila]